MDHNVYIPQLARIIETDPALTLKILEHSNSATYSARGRVTQVEQGLNRLGSRVVQALMLSVLIKDSLIKGDKPPVEMARTVKRLAPVSAVAVEYGLDASVSDVKGVMIDPAEAVRTIRDVLAGSMHEANVPAGATVTAEGGAGDVSSTKICIVFAPAIAGSTQWAAVSTTSGAISVPVQSTERNGNEPNAPRSSFPSMRIARALGIALGD